MGRPGTAFLVDAGTFVFSAAMILMMRTRRAPRSEDEHGSFVADVLEGLRYVRRERWLLIAMVGATVSLLAVWGPWETLVPVVVRNDLLGDAGALGLVFGAGGLGAVITAATFGQRAALPRRPITAMYLAWAGGDVRDRGVPGWSHGPLASDARRVRHRGLDHVPRGDTGHARAAAGPDRLLGRVFALDWIISTMGVPLVRHHRPDPPS